MGAASPLGHTNRLRSPGRLEWASAQPRESASALCPPNELRG